MSDGMGSKARTVFSSYQKLIIGLLAFLQFTIVLDFMILSPLGALLMQELAIPASRFGLAVSVYAFSAGASGLLAAGFADRFDRKRLLLFFYSGFLLGTLLCGLAPTYRFLLVARMITGLFGGVIGSISYAIIADLFAPESRGRVMGFVQTAFSASQVLGIPVGLFLANRWGWHAPFLLIVAVSSLVGVVIALRMRPIVGHLVLQREHDAFRHLFAAVSRKSYLRAYACMMLLVTGGFMVMPFGSAYMVNNVGLSMEQLPIVYMVTGIFSIVAGPFVGKLSDSLGKYSVFCAGSVLALALVIVFTHLGPTPLGWVVVINMFLMLGVTCRIISASALMSIVPDAPDRGAFMAVNASIQQLAGGVAAGAAGLIVVRMSNGQLVHYDTVGYVVAGTMVIAVILLYSVNRQVASKLSSARARSPMPA
jgi:predicted MFS family arabinose efflux permease